MRLDQEVEWYGPEAAVALELVQMDPCRGSYKTDVQVSSEKAIIRREKGEVKFRLTLEGSFMSIQAPSISSPVCGL